MSCHVMARHAASCYVMSSPLMSCHVMPSLLISCFAVSCHVKSCCVMSCQVLTRQLCHVSGQAPSCCFFGVTSYITSCRLVLCYGMSYHLFSCYASSLCYLFSCHVMPCHVTTCRGAGGAQKVAFCPVHAFIVLSGRAFHFPGFLLGHTTLKRIEARAFANYMGLTGFPSVLLIVGVIG